MFEDQLKDLPEGLTAEVLPPSPGVWKDWTIVEVTPYLEQDDRNMVVTDGESWWYAGSPDYVYRTLMDYLVAAGIVVKDSADVYDRMADVYDDRYSDASCAEENAIVADMVRRLLMDCDQPVLDVGCGTGLALELGLIRPENYVGLDPSEGMLKRFLDKFPDLEDALFHDTFEGYRKRTTRYTRYAAIISLFGSPSYIDPVYIHHLFSMAPKVLLMHYVQGYWPDYEGMPLNSNASRKAAAMACEARGGVTIRLNNFQITKVG